MAIIKNPKKGMKCWTVPALKKVPVECEILKVTKIIHNWEPQLHVHLRDTEEYEWVGHLELHNTYLSAYRSARSKLTAKIGAAHRKHKRLLAERKTLEQHKVDRERS